MATYVLFVKLSSEVAGCPDNHSCCTLLPQDTENILVYWKNFTSDHSFKVSIFSQHSMSAFTMSSSSHYSLSHTPCALDAGFLHSFSCCWKDGSIPTFIQVDRWCLPSLFCREQLVVMTTEKKSKAIGKILKI